MPRTFSSGKVHARHSSGPVIAATSKGALEQVSHPVSYSMPTTTEVGSQTGKKRVSNCRYKPLSTNTTWRELDLRNETLPTGNTGRETKIQKSKSRLSTTLQQMR
jgi:hypothetical protein